MASKDLVGEGISAADVVAAGAKLLGGGGSRDPELAQAGGPHGDQLDAALAAAHEAAAARLNGCLRGLKRRGRVLGLDHGTRRVGIAVSDALRITAQPLEVVARSKAVARVTEIVAEYEVDEIVIGLPTSLEAGGRPARRPPPASSARRSPRPPESTSPMSTSDSPP